MVSTNSRQSIVPRNRKLPMLLLTETWSAACIWLPERTSCSMLRPDSARRCSIQVSGRASAGPCPCRRRASSDTNGEVIGGPERAMSAITRIRFFGSRWAVSVSVLAQAPARFRSTRPAEMCVATRRRFSISARRSMMGMAHSSPSRKGVTDW
jgi:hypothetical protein